MQNVSLPTSYQTYIHLSRYARWDENQNRRETWSETVTRYIDYMCDKQCKGILPQELKLQLARAINTLQIMPSMRCLMTAGPALERDNVAGYNCSYITVDRVRAFDECLFILMCGTGVGFSVERQFVTQLPCIPEQLNETDSIIVVRDSRLGWAKAFRELLTLLYAGQIPKYDLSKIRPAGSRLKTFGGRASGPQPLEDLFKFTISLFKEAAGRKLTSIECHDLMCKVAEIVVVGGVRRSALISLSNLSDDRMRAAKSGKWYEENGQRGLANNSVAYTEKPDIGIFMKEWLSLYESKSGERGIFNRVAAKKVAARNGRRDAGFEFGCNPCSEIILRPNQFCNLTEVVVRSDDTLETLREKVKMATILGTMQSTLTNFRHLGTEWTTNTKEEALLGVSLTGIMDNRTMAGRNGKEALAKWLVELRELAVVTNKEWAEKLGVNPSTAITCVKPSGTVSQLVDAASGIHPRHAPYYIRRVRADKKDPLATLLLAQGVPCEDDVTKPEHTYVFSFPIKAPADAIFRKDVDAISQLELWAIYQEHWCEHKPSITVYVKEKEWLEVGSWVYKNFDNISGVAFLPFSDHTYRQAPYEDIDEKKYNELLAAMPKDIDWSMLAAYETEDMTQGTREFSCTGDKCDINS